MVAELAVVNLLVTLTAVTPAAEGAPTRVKEVLELLREVAPRHPSPANFRLRKPIGERFFGDISSAGLLFSDVVPSGPGEVTVDELRRVLKGEKGVVYRYMVALAIDASHCGDYSHLTLQRRGETLNVVLERFDLTFQDEGGSLKLRQVKLTDPGGD